jgi:hypothetical protein
MACIILYTGIDALPNGMHTKSEFMHVMHMLSNNPSILNNDEFPCDFAMFTFEQWISWSGAEMKILSVDSEEDSEEDYE